MILVLPLLFLLTKGKVKLERKDLVYFILIGFVFSAFSLSAFSSIIFGCPIAVANALLYTQPFFTAALAALSGGERITAKKLTIIAVGVIGVFLVSGMFTEQFSSVNVLGVFFALLGGFLYALYLLFKRMRKESYAPLQALFNTFVFAVPCTLILGLFLRFFTDNLLLIGFSAFGNYELLLLFLFTIFSTALPYGSLNYVKANEVSPTIEGTILLLDPLLSVFWGILFFQEFLSLFGYIGVALILLSAGAMLKIENK